MALLAGFIALVAVVALDSNDNNTTETPIQDFIADVKSDRAYDIVVRENNITYKRRGDSAVYRTEMEEGDTLRQVLIDAGIEVQDFANYEIGE